MNFVRPPAGQMTTTVPRSPALLAAIRAATNPAEIEAALAAFADQE
jgi:hypothetical protein